MPETKTQEVANQSSEPVDTNGWDLVSALRFPDVNKAIVAQKSSPKNFSATEGDPDLGTAVFTGDFGDWQLSGGDGKLVWIDMPLANCALNFAGKIHTYSKPMMATVEVNMLWVNEKISPSKFNLKIDEKITVSVQKIDAGENTVSSILLQIMQSALQASLIANIGQFDYAFASVDIAEKADTSTGLDWLKPTDKMYAVISSDSDSSNIEKMIFAVLCMTENRPNPGAHEVSPFAIPDGCRAGFLISPERFMTKMMLNGLPLLFEGRSTIVTTTNTDPETGRTYKTEEETWADPVSINDFSISNLAITNNVAMKFQTQTLDNDKKVDPVIDKGNFHLRFHTEGVELDFADLNFDYTPGISVHIDHTAQSTLEIGPDRKLILNVGTSTTSASVKTSTTVLVLEIVGSIAAAILGSALGGIIGGAVSGGAGAVAGGTEAAIDTITMTAEEAAEGAVINVSEDALSEAGEEAAQSMQAIEGTANAVSKFGRFALFFSKNWPKILGSIIGGTIGGSTGAISKIIEKVANDHANVPTIDDLGTEALAPIHWPNLKDDGFTIKSGGINGCLQLGFDVTTIQS